MALEPGSSAPDFTLKNQHGEDVSLADLRGKPVLLVFFPFAFSGICTGEFCEIRDNLAALHEAAGAEVTVLAISVDHFFANRAFADSENYTFDVLSDFWPHGGVAQAYGVFNDKVGAANRGAFVIDAAGVVRWSVQNPIGEARDFAAYRDALAALS